MSATKQAVDFTNVKEGGNFSKKHMAEGDYLARITKVEDAAPKDKSDNTPMWLFTIQLVQTPSATYPYYCKLQENQLWKVRNLLVAAGLSVPKKRVAVDPNKLVTKLIAVSLEDTEYNDKVQSEVQAVFSANELPNADTSVGSEDEDLETEDEANEYEAPDNVGEEEPEEAQVEQPVKKSKKDKKKKSKESDDEINIEDLD